MFFTSNYRYYLHKATCVTKAYIGYVRLTRKTDQRIGGEMLRQDSFCYPTRIVH